MHNSLASIIPDVDTLLSLPPEEIGIPLLKLAASALHNGVFALDGIAGRDQLFGRGYPDGREYYPQGRAVEIELAVAEAWQWLELNGLIMRAAAPNPSFHRFTRRGLAVAKDEGRLADYSAAAKFPRQLLHPSIADEVWGQLAMGKYAVAIFIAFRSVEEAVRATGGFEATEHGVALMRRAFHKENGPLTRLDDPEPERDALSNLFAGAIGSYKNPHSHRTVEIDIAEAQEMVLLASHLLRIVDSRS